MSSSSDKDLSNFGKHCSFELCNRLDFLPIKCDLCHLNFCKEHFTFINHKCSKYDEKNERNVSNMANLAPINFYTCTFEECKQREMVEVICEFCNIKVCMKHRLQTDHKCSKLQANLVDSKPKIEKQEFKFEVKQNVSEKNAPLAAKLTLMKLKQTAVGPPGLPDQSKYYCFIIQDGNVTSKKPFFFSSKWPVVESKQVVVTNLNKNETLSTIEYYFKTVGQIDKIERNTNNWIITYNDDDSAIDAVVCYNNQKINGNQIQVSFLKKIEPNFNESKKSKRPLTALTPSSSSENVSDLDLIKCLDEFETPKRLCIDKIRQNSVEIVESKRGVNSETHPIILNNYTPDVSGNPEYPIVLSNSEPEKHYSKKLAKKIVYEDDCTEEEGSERDESEEEEDDEDESDNEDEYDSEIYTNESYSNEYYEEYMSDYYDDSYDIDAYIDHCYYINERMAYNNYHYPTVLSTHYIYQNRNNSKSNTIQVQESKSNDDILLELSLYELIHQNARDETSKILNEKTSKSSKSVIVEESDSFVLSLICPITKTRLDNPGRGEECKHLECFNIKAYMQMNQKQNLRSNVAWNCPICSKKTLVKSLYCDTFLVDILKQFDKDVIELKKVDNVWKPYEKNFENNLVFIELS